MRWLDGVRLEIAADSSDVALPTVTRQSPTYLPTLALHGDACPRSRATSSSQPPVYLLSSHYLPRLCKYILFNTFAYRVIFYILCSITNYTLPHTANRKLFIFVTDLMTSLWKCLIAEWSQCTISINFSPSLHSISSASTSPKCPACAINHLKSNCQLNSIQSS